MCMKDDSIEGIYDTLKNCAMISKTAGGIELNIHCVHATGYVFFIEGFGFLMLTVVVGSSYIAGTNGYSNGSVPMLCAYDTTARYIDKEQTSRGFHHLT